MCVCTFTVIIFLKSHQSILVNKMWLQFLLTIIPDTQIKTVIKTKGVIKKQRKARFFWRAASLVSAWCWSRSLCKALTPQQDPLLCSLKSQPLWLDSSSECTKSLGPEHVLIKSEKYGPKCWAVHLLLLSSRLYCATLGLGKVLHVPRLFIIIIIAPLLVYSTVHWGCDVAPWGLTDMDFFFQCKSLKYLFILLSSATRYHCTV